MPGGPPLPVSPLIRTGFVSPLGPGVPLKPSREQEYYWIFNSDVISWKNISEKSILHYCLNWFWKFLTHCSSGSISCVYLSLLSDPHTLELHLVHWPLSLLSFQELQGLQFLQLALVTQPFPEGRSDLKITRGSPVIKYPITAKNWCDGKRSQPFWPLGPGNPGSPMAPEGPWAPG